MALNVKSKILLTVLSVVLMFTFFILFYFPARQEKALLENYNEEIENFANSVALGVKIALTEQNFEGVETAIDFVRDDSRLHFVSIIQSDTVWNSTGDLQEVDKTVFRTFPEGTEVDTDATSNDAFIYKTAAFSTPIMTGEVMLSFTTQEIVESMEQIRITSIFASLIVFGIGLGIGYLLARNISEPVLALRDAAQKVGEGDLSQSVESSTGDEIGELTVAFNNMVRELKIEAAMEKIRNRTIAMQHSDELKEMLDVFLVQTSHLEFNALIYKVVLKDPDGQEWECRILIKGSDQPGSSKLAESDAIYYESERTRGSAEIVYREIENIENVKAPLADKPLIASAAIANHGVVEVVTEKKLAPQNETLLLRLANVLDQSFIRYLDLKKSEEQGLEAVKRASMDRIRGEVASMRSKKDLNRIIPLLWRELKSLNVPFFRCGVFIMNEESESVYSYLSNPEGKSLAVLNLPFDNSTIIKDLVSSWRKQKVYVDVWDQAAFIEWGQSLVNKNHIESIEDYVERGQVPDSLALHFVPFDQGMLYAGSAEPLDKQQIDLVQSLADAFAVAYARYEDFHQLEQAKKKVEQALAELEAAQEQLVQQEKLASLGQLTAGIAHEIKNPLNFVNNFSEVSLELIEEVREELGNQLSIVSDKHTAEGKREPKASSIDHIVPPAGEGADVPDGIKADGVSDDSYIREILDDLEANLRKIHEHGNRADSIVKSMLQHSRGGDGQKELVDLNAFVKEYINLAFHGMRAGKNPMNVDIELDLEEDISTIPLIAEDFSRVILNLCNNAFDAMKDKLSEISNQQSEYLPKLTVKTSHSERNIGIEIADNGSGIPKEIKDKILQPFFTTKKGTDGTGLGLSITNDIVKAHGGTIKIESESGSYTRFIIKLPT